MDTLSFIGISSNRTIVPTADMTLNTLHAIKEASVFNPYEYTLCFIITEMADITNPGKPVQYQCGFFG